MPGARVQASRGMATLAHVAITHLDASVGTAVPKHHLSVNSRPTSKDSLAQFWGN